ncbi:type I restriction enzyme M protein [Rhizobium sp. PP-F2F-G36]|nr:type I restriction enzyme M protein [Rhizobium sp. PP-F2F-G36]
MQTPATSNRLGQFFTRSNVGDFVVQQFETDGTPRAIDLGAGAGALSLAIRRRWQEAAITTVDIDKTSGTRISKVLEGQAAGTHHHLTADILDEDLPELLSSSQFELVVCNPPYLRIEWRESFRRILADAGLHGLHAMPPDFMTSDVLFVAQVLRLASAGAEIALIVPDGLISGSRARSVREALLARTNVRRVIQLPRGSFHGTEAQAHVIVLRNEPPRGTGIGLGSLTTSGETGARIITAEEAARRMDWNFYSESQGPSGSSLRSLGAVITRGRLSSKEARTHHQPVFHTSGFKDSWNHRIVLPCSNDDTSTTAAEPGDILLARVDRSLETKVCLVEQGASEITDCVFRIRLPEEHRSQALKALTSTAGCDSLRRAARGVGARMLSKNDLLDMELTLS